MLNNENTCSTERGTSYTGDCWGMGGLGKGWQRVGSWEGIVLGEISNVDDRVMDAANHHGT